MGQLEYFPAFFGYLESLKKLDDAQVGRVFRAALRYAKDGAEPDLDPVEDMAFTFIRGDIDRAKAKYDEKCEKLRANGMKKWENDAESKSMQMHADASDRMQMDAEASKQNKTKQDNTIQYNTNESVASADAKPARGKAKKKAFSPPTVEEVAAYCKDKGLNTIDPEYFVRFYSESDWIKANGKPVQNWKSTVLTWAQRDKERGIAAKTEAKPEKRGSFETDDFMAAAFARTQRVMEEEARQNGENAGSSAGSGWEDYRKG